MNPVMLLHGALGSATQLETLKAKLEQGGRKVFLLNFSGHSGQPFSNEGFGIEVFANDLLSMLDREQIAQADVFGYSMGGYVALWCAFKNPHRFGKIVTLGSKFDWSPASAEKEIRKMNAEKIEEKVPAFARLLHHRHLPNDWKQVLKRTAEMMLGLGQKPLLQENVFQQISNQVTILLGDQDDMADREFSQQVASWLPNGEFELLPETPHPIEKVNLEYITRRFL